MVRKNEFLYSLLCIYITPWEIYTSVCEVRRGRKCIEGKGGERIGLNWRRIRMEMEEGKREGGFVIR